MQIHNKINQLEIIEQRLSAKKAILVDQAFHSTNPSDLIKANNVMKSITPYEEVDRKSYLVDPYQFNSFMGYKDKPYSLSYQMLKRMSYGVPIIRAIIGTRIDQVADYCEVQKDKYSIGFVIRLKQPHYNTGEQPKITREQIQKIDEITEFILNCGTDANSFESDDFDTFVRKIINDSLTYDQMTFEVTRNPLSKKLTGFYAVDASTMRIADSYDQQHFDNTGNKDVERINWGGNKNITNKKQYGYYPKFCQIKDQIAVADYYPWEMSFGVRNPTTDIYSNGYGISEQEILTNTITSMLWGDEYNRRFFSQGSAPKGLLKIKAGSSMNAAAMAQFKQQWQSMMSGVYNCVAGDVAILTAERGKIKIEDYIGDSIEKKATIWTGKDYIDGLVYRTPEKKRLIESFFESGRSIKTSPNHKFLIPNDDGECVWCEQKDLKIGQIVVADNYNFDKLLSVTDHGIEIDMFDVSINDEEHRFVGNGLILSNSWKTPIMEADVDWVDLQKSNQDMEYSKWQEYLIKLSTAIYRIDPSEINFPLSGGSNDRMFGTDGGTKERIQNSKDKGLYPLLKFLQRKINKYIVSQIDPRFEFAFQGLDVDDPKEELEADIKMMGNFMTIDEIRVRRGLIPLGEENGGNVIANSIWLQNKNAQAMAEQQQQQMQDQQGGQGEEQQGQGEDNPDDSAEDEQDDDESDPFTKAFQNYLTTLQAEEI